MNWPKIGWRLGTGSDIKGPPQAEARVKFGHGRGYLADPEGAKGGLVRVGGTSPEVAKGHHGRSY
jgi:hypothetical protein